MPASPRDNPTNTLSISGSVQDGVAHLQVSGPLSLRTTDRLDRCLIQLRRGGVSEVDIGLAQLTRLDSAGVALLLRLQHHASREGWRVRLVAPPEHLRHQLVRMNVAQRLDFVPD